MSIKYGLLASSGFRRHIRWYDLRETKAVERHFMARLVARYAGREFLGDELNTRRPLFCLTYFYLDYSQRLHRYLCWSSAWYNQFTALPTIRHGVFVGDRCVSP